MVAAWLVSQAVPAWSLPREGGAPVRIGSWIEQVLGQMVARWPFIGPGATDIPIGTAEASAVERIDARQRHHLTIEPGGDALPPPPAEDGAPSQG
jgi:hypothetical protein